MDFIEKLFGVSPDGGNGAVEFLILAAAALAIIAVGIALRRYFEKLFSGRAGQAEERDREDRSGR